MNFFTLLAINLLFLSSNLLAIVPIEEIQKKEYCINEIDALKISKYSLKKFKHLKILNEENLIIRARLNYPSAGINNNGNIEVHSRGFGNSNLSTREDIKVIITPKLKKLMSVKVVSYTTRKYNREFSVNKFFSHFRDFYEKWPSKINCK